MPHIRDIKSLWKPSEYNLFEWAFSGYTPVSDTYWIVITTKNRLEITAMKKISTKLGVMQNLGWHDRIFRVVIGSLMIAIPCYLLATSQSESVWLFYAMLVAVYPLMTGIIGIDQLYNWAGVKSCGTSSRNQCGTFPYEIDAALGHNPIPDSDIEHSLEHSHH